MSTNILYVTEGVQSVGVDESLVFSFTTTPWGASPTVGTLKVLENVNGAWADRTSTIAPSGSPSAVGDVISLPAMKNWTEGGIYLAICVFTAGSNTFAAHIEIQAER